MVNLLAAHWRYNTSAENDSADRDGNRESPTPSKRVRRAIILAVRASPKCTLRAIQNFRTGFPLFDGLT